jgi:hypothetical protein
LENWRTKAIECFPELKEKIDRNQTGPLGLWDDLFLALVNAYEQQPVNEELIARIYDYAGWCLGQPQTGEVQTDPSNAVAVGLIENLPLNKVVLEDLYRWVSVETFRGCESLFRYHLGDEEYRSFSVQFLEKKKNFSGPSRF